MKLVLIISLLTGIMAGQNNQVVNLINKQRSKHGLDKIYYSKDLHNELKDFQETINDDSWFYEDTVNESSSFTYGNTTRTNTLKGQFLKLEHGESMYRDTCKNDRRAIVRIVRMRIREERCFDFNKCNNSSFNLFTSCMKDPIVFENGNFCSWSWAYAPFHLLKDLKYIAIARLDTIGRYVPDHLVDIQHNAFWIYRNKFNISSDKVF
jgi:hypothetical protein